MSKKLFVEADQFTDQRLNSMVETQFNRSDSFYTTADGKVVTVNTHLKALQLSDKTEKAKDTYKLLVQQEVVEKRVPHYIFIGGAYRRTAKSLTVTYHGKYASQLYTYYAQLFDFPTFVSASHKYIPGSVTYLRAAQEELETQAWVQNSPGVLSVPGKVVYGLEDLPLVFYRVNTYDFVGVIGDMCFKVADSPELITVEWYYRINRELSPLFKQVGNLKKETALQKHMLACLRTKFKRTCLENFYSSMPIPVDIAKDEDSNSSIEDDVEEAQEQMEEDKSSRRAMLDAKREANGSKIKAVADKPPPTSASSFFDDLGV